MATEVTLPQDHWAAVISIIRLPLASKLSEQIESHASPGLNECQPSELREEQVEGLRLSRRRQRRRPLQRRDFPQTFPMHTT